MKVVRQGTTKFINLIWKSDSSIIGRQNYKGKIPGSMQSMPGAFWPTPSMKQVTFDNIDSQQEKNELLHPWYPIVRGESAKNKKFYITNLCAVQIPWRWEPHIWLQSCARHPHLIPQRSIRVALELGLEGRKPDCWLSIPHCAWGWHPVLCGTAFQERWGQSVGYGLDGGQSFVCVCVCVCVHVFMRACVHVHFVAFVFCFLLSKIRI